MKFRCLACGRTIENKDIIAINRKLLGENVAKFYCLDCFAEYLGTTVEELIDKIEEFKEEGCKLFQ